MSTEGNRNHTRQMGREFKALNYNLFSFKKGIRLEHKPEICLPSILNIPTTKNKSSRYVTFYFIVFIFPSCSGVPSSLDTAGPSLPEDIPGAKKNTSKEPFFFFIWNAVDYIKCQIFSKHFPRDNTPINSSHIHLTFHTLSTVLPTDLLVLLQESG